ncbi:hypothetical protein AB0J74_29770 [Asanoa sp. NPDC049573]|uniref:hypothetical protein n=1 Tax=Asanoa sp. NPDC049573 TaxID=3155396 RepID=UPI0034181989
MAWFLNPALTRFRNEVDSRWPRRDRTSDGTIGDLAHQATSSDHNPDRDGSVDAWDMDVDGVDVQKVIAAALKHESIQYVIYNRRITSRSWGLGTWRPYTGPSPHTEHVHFNTRESHENSTKPWFTDQPEDDMFEARDRDALTSANFRALGIYQDLDTVSFKVSNGSVHTERNVAKAARIALEQKVSAVLTALSSVDEAVAAQLRGQFAEIDAGFAETKAAIDGVDEAVLEGLGALSTPEEQAKTLRVVLGDRAKEIGLLLSQG